MPITLVQGQVDAVVPWEPYTAQAVRELGANAVVVSRGEEGLVTDIIGVVAHENWIGKNYDLLEKFSIGIAQAAAVHPPEPEGRGRDRHALPRRPQCRRRDRRAEVPAMGPAHLGVHHPRGWSGPATT